MSTVDIVLVKPGSQNQIYGHLASARLTAIEPPLWAAILAGFLRDKGYSVLLLDAEIENWTYQQTAQTIVEADPVLTSVVVSGTNPSASTMNMTGAERIISCVSELNPELKTILTGLHPSALPERTLREVDVDFVCQGEGFHTLPALIDAIKADSTEPVIDGLWYKRGDQIISGRRPELVENLEAVGQPAWDLLPMDSYRAHNWHCFDSIGQRSPYAVLYTSLGCPFKCSFCCINALFGKNTIRYRPIDSVMQELDYLVESYGIRNIKIMDEMFAMSERRIVELCDRIIERNYDLNFWVYARVNTVTGPMLKKMKLAGINWLAYGFESGSKKVIEDITKGYKTDLVKNVVRMTYDEGLYICGNYIFGLPEDDYDSMNETLELMFDINAEWANIYCAMAYPGSKLYEMAIKNGWQQPKSWQDYSQYCYELLPLQTNHLSAGQVLAFRDYAFHAYYDNPRYLSMIREKFGPETLAHIREMASRKLERKYACI